MIKLGNKMGWFKVGGNTMQVHEVQLLHDVRTSGTPST